MTTGKFLWALVFSAGISSTAAQAMSCLEERGADAAQALVDACTEVSPATHPPCNAANSCDLIESEVKRGCSLLARRDRPAFCKDVGE